MGGTSSKSVAKVTNRNAVNIVQKSVSNCRASSVQSQTQNIVIDNGSTFSGKTDQTMSVKVNLECVVKTKKQVELRRELSNMLAQTAHASGTSGLSFMSNTKGETSTNIFNMFTAAFNQTEINNIASTIQQNQTQNITVNNGATSTADFSQTMDAKSVTRALLESSSYASVIDAVTNEIDQKSSAKDSLLPSMPSLLIIGFLVLVAMGIAAGIIVKSRKGSWQQASLEPRVPRVKNHIR